MNLGREDEFREFKESLGQLDKGLKSISAMLNRHNSAIVYFGVDDNGNIVGLQAGKDTLMDIRNKIRDKIEPRIYPDIKEEKDENGKTYIKVSVSGADIPYSYDGRYYIRNVSSDEQASNEILRKMLSSSDADIIRQKISPKQNLTFKAFFADEKGNINTPTIVFSNGVTGRGLIDVNQILEVFKYVEKYPLEVEGYEKLNSSSTTDKLKFYFKTYQKEKETSK